MGGERSDQRIVTLVSPGSSVREVAKTLAFPIGMLVASEKKHESALGLRYQRGRQSNTEKAGLGAPHRESVGP